MLKGCDISEFQSADVDIDPYDFVIVRSSYGVGEKDAKMDIHAKRVLDKGKLLGFYHYAYPDTGNTGAAEARSMIECVKPYLGKCVLALDWEGAAVSYPASWCVEFLDTLKKEAGVTGFFYTFAIEIQSNKYDSVAAKYPLWIAQWGVSEPEIGPSWKKWTLWQYQGDPFDLDNFDGTKADWQKWAGAKAPEWVTKNAYLTESEMQNNAQLLWNYFQPLGWTLNAVAAMAGNMEKESTLSPGIWGDLEPWGDPEYKGYGLVQWTPYTRITNWLTEHGYKLTDGNAQCEKLVEEMEHPEIEVTWIETSSYPISFKEFAFSNKDPGWLAMAFLANYERPADPNQPDRAERARKWYTYLASGFVYVPRLDTAGMEGSKYYYSDNPFYLSGYGLPNCTCYAYGRWYEITGEKPTDLSLGNANTWWDIGVERGIPHGGTPKLGAIVCFYYSDEDGGGHVAVVEKINADGTIVTSNSAWGGSYFYLQTLVPPDYRSESGWPSYGYVQGFLYLPETYVPPPEPPEPPKPERKRMKFIYYLKQL